MPGIENITAPWMTLASWNALPATTQTTELAQHGVIIATIKPNLFLLQFPQETFLLSDWMKYTAVEQQAKADMVGGVAITNG